MMMDDLIDNLASSFTVNEQTGVDVSGPHPAYGKGKTKATVAQSQRKRRLEKLEEQKEARFDALAKARELAYDEADPEQQTNVNRRRYNQTYISQVYRNQLMLSEWLVDLPPNFESDWLLVPSPEGKRCIVVASQGSTRLFSKAGYFMKEFRCALPGGSGGKNASQYAVLDAIYSEKDRAVYIIDLICWNEMPFHDSETALRFFWLKSKFDENPELGSVPKDPQRNPRLVHLGFCDCTRASMTQFMQTEFPCSKLDGLLFYHKEVHYTAGQTPLVGWLKPFMLPEILGVAVPEKYLEGHQNESAGDFIAAFNDEAARRDAKRTGVAHMSDVSAE